MRNFKILSLTFILLILSACSKPMIDNELSGDLLIGPFAITVITAPVAEQKFNQLEGKSDEELIAAYKKIYGTSYSRDFEPQAKAVLLKDYKVTDEAGTETTINDLLKNVKSSEYKAYEFAKAANVANFAYASGYITEDEAKAHEQTILKETRVHYSDWKSYLNEFVKGREEAKGSENPEAQKLFTTIVDELLLKNENSPYLKAGL